MYRAGNFLFWKNRCFQYYHFQELELVSIDFFLDSQSVSRCCWVRFHYIPVDHKGQYKGMAMNSTCDGLWRDWRMDRVDSIQPWVVSMKETPKALGSEFG